MKDTLKIVLFVLCVLGTLFCVNLYFERESKDMKASHIAIAMVANDADHFTINHRSVKWWVEVKVTSNGRGHYNVKLLQLDYRGEWVESDYLSTGFSEWPQHAQNRLKRHLRDEEGRLRKEYPYSHLYTDEYDYEAGMINDDSPTGE